LNKTLRNSFGLMAVGTLVLALGPKVLPKDAPTPTAPTASGPGVLVVDLVDGNTDSELASLDQATGLDFEYVSADAHDDGIVEGWVPDLAAAEAAIDGLGIAEVAEPDVQYVLSPDEQLSNAATATDADGVSEGYPNDPLYGKQWHMKAMGAPAGWATTPRGKGIVVAVIDTGVTKVEDLENTKILEGKSFVPGTRSAADDNGHGTHCAGTIAESTNNGKGVAGVAPDAQILPVKVLSGGGFGSSGWIASGIDWATDNGADVISLSLGGGYSMVIHNAIKRAEKKGVIVVAAAGNSGREGVSYPGALKETIGVSAVGPDGNLAFYSSWGKGVDISAPGGNKKIAGGGVWQDTIDGKGGHQYAEFQGTSMATPHVAGAAAVLLSNGMEPAAVKAALLDTANRGGLSGTWDPKYGRGRLDLSAALGKVIDRYGALRFALAALMAWMVTQAAGLKTEFRVASAAIAGFVGGGLFFLDYLPLPDFFLFHLLSRPLLLWPALIDSRIVNFPLWLSAGLPAGLAFTAGAFKKTRPIALGVVCGVGAHLVHGAGTGSLNPWWMPGGLDVVWLVGNGIVCVLLGLALAGAEKMDKDGIA